ncbi:MAG: acyl--CoA ligase [Actinomycetota bacterium]|nr:acyl--CoA ligase [Actinomycetota bacterium]
MTRLPQPMPLAPTLAAACRRWPDRTAITYHGRHLTYEELRRQIQLLAAAYRELGIAPGNRVICQMPDCPQFVVALGAAWACGAIHVGADKDLTGSELAGLAERTDAAAVVFQPPAGSPDPLAPVRALAETRTRTTVIVDQARPEDGQLALSQLLAGRSEPQEPLGDPPFRPHDPALLFMTSGTTGEPKAVMETLPALWAKMDYFAQAYGPGPLDVHLMYLPMSHAFGLKLTLTALASGGRLVMLDRFSPSEALRLVSEEQVTILPGTPTHFELVCDQLDPSRHRVDSLRWGVAAAAPLTPRLLQQIYDRLRVDLFYVYGCSEGFLVTTTDRGELERGSVGRDVFKGPQGTPPDGRVCVQHPDRRVPLRSGEVGEIVFGASQPVRYWQAASAAGDGWYRTGDLGRVDPDGCLFVVGRLKDLVNRGGLKVAPGEIEATLVRHPGVIDGAIIGTPDPVLGEAICACIVPASEDAPHLAALRSFLATSLARHKLPDELCVVDAIPRSKIGKVDRRALRALVVDGDRPRERLRPVSIVPNRVTAV